MNEFQLINHFFSQQKHDRSDVILGIGDDCAVVRVPSNHELLMSMDTLVSGVHFPKSTIPFDIGYKALAVNLSDLAAMGATPAWFTLAITMPSVDISWIKSFSDGLFAIAQPFDMQLIGGDTTKGPLAITIQVHGFVPQGRAIRRTGAKPGDLIYASHHLGDAGLALACIQQKIKLPLEVFALIEPRLNRPVPRINESLLIARYASSMIDLSDGLISDLAHILTQSKVGAVLDASAIPISKELIQSVGQNKALHYALTSGDDYELCWTMNPNKQDEFECAMREHNYSFYCIGAITANSQLFLQQKDEVININNWQGYMHF